MSIICLGSIVFFAFVGCKLCSIKCDKAEESFTKISSWLELYMCQCGTVEEATSCNGLHQQQSDTASPIQKTSNVQEATCCNGLPQHQSDTAIPIQDTSESGSDSRSKISAIRKYKKLISVLIIIYFATVFSIVVDTSIAIQHPDVARYTLSNLYGGINFCLFVLASISILVMIVILCLLLIANCTDKRKCTTSGCCKKNS